MFFERRFKQYRIDKKLLAFYKSPDGNSITEFQKDVQVIYELKKDIRKWINKNKVKFLPIRNKYIILRNVFGFDGLEYIAAEYFQEDDPMEECFCSLVYYFDSSCWWAKWMSQRFLQFLGKNDTYKYK